MLSPQELRSSTVKELHFELANARKELMKNKMGAKTKNLKDLSKVSKQKTYVAQIKTVLREIDLEEQVRNAGKIGVPAKK